MGKIGRINMSTHIVIMAGGVGSRLYPLSTLECPKQFLDLLGTGKTLIRMTYERLMKVDPDAVVWVVTSSAYRHLVKEQIPGIPDEMILSEPEARNTAPCISYVARKIAIRYPDACIVVTPSDAYVPDGDAFALTIRTAIDFASSHDAIVCIGIRPDSPNTGYGYIAAREDGFSAVPVSAFKEKPDLATARRYLADGGYLWNAGIFVCSAGTVESELREHAPQIESVMDVMEPSFYTSGEQDALQRHFHECEKISFDYAVMERSSSAYVVPAEWDWSDLGSFEAIEKITGREIDIKKVK